MIRLVSKKNNKEYLDLEQMKKAIRLNNNLIYEHETEGQIKAFKVTDKSIRFISEFGKVVELYNDYLFYKVRIIEA